MEEHNSEHTQYEIGFLIPSEDQKTSVTDLLAKHNCEIQDGAETHGKRISLAYPIKKKTAAYFGWIRFFASPDKIEQLNRDIQFTEDVLRFLIVTPPKHIDQEPTQRREQAPYPVEGQQKEEQQQPVVEDKPISNEELEKRIEEILK